MASRRAASIAMGGGAHVAVRVASLLSIVVTAPLLARHLGAAGFGQWTLLLTVTLLLTHLVDLGLPMLAGRDWPRLDDEARPGWLRRLWRLRLVSAGLVWLASSAVAMAWLQGPMRPAALIALAVVPVTLVGSTAVAVFTADLNPWPAMRNELIARGSWLVLLPIAVVAGSGLAGIVGVQLVAQAAATTVALTEWQRWRRSRTRDPADGTDPGSLLRLALPLAVLPLLGIVYARIDTLMLAALTSDAEVGVYGAIWRVVEVLMSVVAIGGALLLPLLSGARHPDRVRHYRRALRLGGVLIFPAAVALAVLAGPVLTLFAGKGFFVAVATPSPVVSAETTLAVLMAVAALMVIGIINGVVMVATHRHRALLRQMALVVAINVAGNVLLIPRWSFLGAAAASLLSELASLAHSTAVLRRAGYPSPVGIMRRPVLLTAVVALPLIGAGLHLPVAAVAVAAGLWAVLLWRSRAWLGLTDPRPAATPVPPPPPAGTGPAPGTVAVVTVTYGDRASQLAQVLAGLGTSDLAERIRSVVVVDNGAGASTRSVLASPPSGLAVDVVPMGENAGSAAGFGAGIRRALDGGADYLWLLDDDNVPAPDALSRLLSAANEHGPTTALQAMRRSYPHLHRLAGGAAWVEVLGHHNSFLGESLRHRLLPRRRRSSGERHPPMEWATFGGFFAPRAAFTAAGVPTTEYVIYADDTEYTHRMGRLGYRIRLVPDAEVVDVDDAWWTRAAMRPGPTAAITPKVRTADERRRLYYTVRNSVDFERCHRVDNRAEYLVNMATKHVALGMVTVWSALRSGSLDPLRAYRTYLTASHHGMTGRLGHYPGAGGRDATPPNV